MGLPERSRDRVTEPPTIEGGEGALFRLDGGLQTYHGESPHIWQEYKLYRESGLRPIKGARLWGRHWWILPLTIVIAAAAVVFEPARAIIAAFRYLF
jgi:hypothetical protein